MAWSVACTYTSRTEQLINVYVVVRPLTQLSICLSCVEIVEKSTLLPFAIINFSGVFFRLVIG